MWPLIGLGFGLRAWHLDFGLPDAWTPDEVKASQQLVVLLGEPGPPFGYEHPPLLRVLAAAVLWTLGWGHDPAQATLALRVVSLLASTAEIGVVYAIARRVVSSPAAVGAAAVLAVAPLTVFHGRYGVPDPLTAFLSSAAVLAGVVAAERRSTPWWALAGALCGLAATAKYPGALACLAIAVAWWGGGRRPAHLALAAAAAAASFVAGLGLWPGLLLRTWRAVGDEAGSKLLTGHGGQALGVEEYGSQLLQSWAPAVGLPVFGLTLVGIGLWLFGRRREGAVALAWLLPAWGLAELTLRTPPCPERYLLPAAGGLALAAAAGAEAVIGLLPAGRWRRWGAWGLAGLCLLPMGWRSVAVSEAMDEDTRDRMAAWIDANLPAEAPVMVTGERFGFVPALQGRPTVDLFRGSGTLGRLGEVRYILVSSLLVDRYLRWPTEGEVPALLVGLWRDVQPLHVEADPSGALFYHQPELRLYDLPEVGVD